VILLYIYPAAVSSDPQSRTHNKSKKCSNKTPSHAKTYSGTLLLDNISHNNLFCTDEDKEKENSYVEPCYFTPCVEVLNSMVMTNEYKHRSTFVASHYLILFAG